MRYFKTVLPLVVSLTLAGCGTYVPGIEEPLSTPVEGQQFVQAIVNNIDCEIRDAVGDIIRRDIDEVRTGFRKIRRTVWLDKWGVQTTLTLQINERGAVNPHALFTPANPVTLASLAVGASVSAEATRENKIGSYYAVGEIVRGPRCGQEGRPNGLFLLQNDLKLREWLLDVSMLQGSGVAQVPVAKDILQHHITFEVITSAGVTPTLILSRVLLNGDGSLLEAKRGRKHDLIITLGPLDPSLVVAGPRLAARRAAPARAAADLHLASEIGVAVSNALRSAR